MAGNTNYNVSVCAPYIRTASQTQGSQRRDMLFTLAVNPTETVTNYSFSTALGEGEKIVPVCTMVKLDQKTKWSN